MMLNIFDQILHYVLAVVTCPYVRELLIVCTGQILLIVVWMIINIKWEIDEKYEFYGCAPVIWMGGFSLGLTVSGIINFIIHQSSIGIEKNIWGLIPFVFSIGISLWMVMALKNESYGESGLINIKFNCALALIFTITIVVFNLLLPILLPGWLIAMLVTFLWFFALGSIAVNKFVKGNITIIFVAIAAILFAVVVVLMPKYSEISGAIGTRIAISSFALVLLSIFKILSPTMQRRMV